MIIYSPQNIPGVDESSLHKVVETYGYHTIEGRIASKVWIQTKMTVKEASSAIRQDIMRSLAARFEMHFDSLIEEECSKGKMIILFTFWKMI